MKSNSKPTDMHYYHARIMEDVEDAEWLRQEDNTLEADVITKECGIHATKDESCLL
jgi:hypothetical protein